MYLSNNFFLHPPNKGNRSLYSLALLTLLLQYWWVVDEFYLRINFIAFRHNFFFKLKLETGTYNHTNLIALNLTNKQTRLINIIYRNSYITFTMESHTDYCSNRLRSHDQLQDSQHANSLSKLNFLVELDIYHNLTK